MKIGISQMNIFWEDKEKNKESCLKFLKQAKTKGVDIVFFPEMTLTGFSMDIEKVGETDNATVDWFKERAIEFKCYIGFGHVTKKGEKGVNNLSIVSPEGKEISRYEKIHPFSYGKENEYYESGNNIVISEVNGCKIATFICYDLRFPEVFQIASNSADIIVVIANWPEARKNHWITLLKARAIENQSYVIGINRVGVRDSIEYSGNSMAIDPLGEIISEQSENECLLVVDVNPDEVCNVRKTFKLKDDRKEALYLLNYLKQIEPSKEYLPKPVLLGKNIIVAGACGLIGRKICKGISEFGGNVIVADINAKEAENLSEELRAEHYTESISFPLNITSEESIHEMLTFIKRHLGSIHGLVNSAYPRNKHYGAKFENISLESWRENIDMHLNGYFNIIQSVSKHMMDQGYGKIINMGSVYGILGPDFSIYEGTNLTMPAEYSAIKGGIINFTRYLATYLGKYNINVNCISPGGVFNNQPEEFINRYSSKTPLGRLAQPEDIVGGVIYLLSDMSDYITGHNLVIDGGWSAW